MHVYSCPKMQKLQVQVCGLYAFIYVHVCVCIMCMCVCALRGGCTVLSHAAGVEQSVGECACHCSKWGKKREGEKRSAVKVAEAHKRKERDRKNLLSLIRVSASPSSFGEPKHEPTSLFFLFYSVFLKTFSFCSHQNIFYHFFSNYTCTPFCHLLCSLCHPICLSKGWSGIAAV